MALARLTKSNAVNVLLSRPVSTRKWKHWDIYQNRLWQDVKAPVTADIAAPILRETVSRVVDGKVVTMYKDELEKILYKDLYSHLGLQFGG